MEEENFFPVFILLIYLCFFLVNNAVDEVYMDEVFHLDQTENYFYYNYKKWNSKLTTFPGTFYVTSKFLGFISVFRNITKGNILFYSRLFTLMISMVSSFMLSKYFSSNNLFIFTIVLLPISFFFNFLYYTDTFSTFGLILHFYFIDRSSKIWLFASSAFAVLVRQNNIIWINLFPLAEGIRTLEIFLKDKNFNRFKEVCLMLLKRYSPIVIIDVAFIGFLYWNNFKVVLGDHSHHDMCLHFAQFAHLAIITLGIFPYLNVLAFKVLKNDFYRKEKIQKFILYFVGILVFLIFVSSKCSFTHDFILSDNRHYSFYYMKRIYNNLQIRNLALIYSSFIYALLITEFNINLLNHKVLAYFICLTMCIVPAKLFEFRYFIPCYVVLMILLQKSLFINKSLIFNRYHILAFLIENIVTLVVFTYFPFKNHFMKWEKSRFMY